MKKKINRLIENQMKRLHKTLELKLYDDRTWEELDKKCIELEIQIDKLKEEVDYWQNWHDYRQHYKDNYNEY